MATERKNKGCQRIEMKKMTKGSNLQATFSKRRSGIFKKASELSTLCGAKVAIIVFSPGKKAFSFGHRSVEEVIDQFLMWNSNVQIHSNSMNGAANNMHESPRNTIIRDLNFELTQVNNKLEAVKKEGKQLNQMNNQIQNWWEAPIENLQPDQLDQLRAAIQKLQMNVNKEVEKFWVAEISNNNNNHGGVFGYGGAPHGFL